MPVAAAVCSMSSPFDAYRMKMKTKRKTKKKTKKKFYVTYLQFISMETVKTAKLNDDGNNAKLVFGHLESNRVDAKHW